MSNHQIWHMCPYWSVLIWGVLTASQTKQEPPSAETTEPPEQAWQPLDPLREYVPFALVSTREIAHQRTSSATCSTIHIAECTRWAISARGRCWLRWECSSSARSTLPIAQIGPLSISSEVISTHRWTRNTSSWRTDPCPCWTCDHIVRSIRVSTRWARLGHHFRCKYRMRARLMNDLSSIMSSVVFLECYIVNFARRKHVAKYWSLIMFHLPTSETCVRYPALLPTPNLRTCHLEILKTAVYISALTTHKVLTILRLFLPIIIKYRKSNH